jgi:MFS transporter, ACS family, tartrate transporter
VTLFYLTDWPREANWLRKEERDWISGELQREHEVKARTRPATVWEALRKREVILLTLVHFFALVGIYGFVIWFTSPDSGPCCGTVGIPTGTVKGLVYGGSAVSGAACLGVALAAGSNLLLGFVAMVVVGACTTAFLPTFWALPTEMLTASAAAASIGLINSVGNLGGFAGPSVIGYLGTATNSFTPGLLFVSASMFLAGMLVLTVKVNHD